MTSSKTWTAGAAVIGVLLVIAAWFLAISPQRSEAADLRDQATAQLAANDQIRIKTKQLQAQFASLPARQAQLEEIKQQMPDNPALPSLIRDLSTYAGQSDVTLVAVSPGTPTVVSADGAATKPGTPVVAPGTEAATTAASPLQAIPTAIKVVGSYPQLTLYLQKLQTQMRRVILVESISLEQANETANLSKSVGDQPLEMTLGGQIFVMTTDPTTTLADGGSAGSPAASTSSNAS